MSNTLSLSSKIIVLLKYIFVRVFRKTTMKYDFVKITEKNEFTCMYRPYFRYFSVYLNITTFL